MVTKIYYFSGTGNSLYAARVLQSKLDSQADGQCALIPLAKFRNDQKVDITESMIGFVYPTYFLTLPDIVADFVSKLNFSTNTYVFSVVTCNGSAGNSLHALDRLLRMKNQTLSIGCILNMPGNALITPSDITKDRLNNCLPKLLEIAECIRSHKILAPEGKDTTSLRLQSVLLKEMGKLLEIHPRKFLPNSNCIGCGICQRICPTGNITLHNNSPHWGRDCTRCLACYHWCPKTAIGITHSFLSGREQYHHPDITAKDLYLVR